MRDVLVLGAGMVGVATALALQEKGRDVLLVDRRDPGRETSHGNAGIIQTEAAEPYPMPRGPAALARVALRLGNDVRWHLDALPGAARPLLAYFRGSAGAAHRAASATYARLTRRAAADHAPLAAAAGADHLITREGYRQAYRSRRAHELAAAEAERVGREHGVPFAVEDGAALARAEPALRRPMAGAVHWTGPWSCADPGALVRAYADLFVRRGGTLAQGDAATLRAAGSGWRVTLAGGGDATAAEAVVALGPWSPRLLAGFGYRVLMVGKRGYHRHYAAASGPRLPLMDVEHGVVAAPMRQGLRLTTGAEIARPDAAATPVQLGRAARAVAELFDLGAPEEAAPWAGVRPCLPDMLPVAGAAPRHPGLWLHFGHGHQGFTLGPTTAAILADVMDGRAPPLAGVLAPRNRPLIGLG